MPSFSILRRSPKGHKRGDPPVQDDAKTSSTPEESDVSSPSPPAASRINSTTSSTPEPEASKPSDAHNRDGRKERRGFNRDLLHDLRSRLVGKQPPAPSELTPQRGRWPPRRGTAVEVSKPRPRPPPFPRFSLLIAGLGKPALLGNR